MKRKKKRTKRTATERPFAVARSRGPGLTPST